MNKKSTFLIIALLFSIITIAQTTTIDFENFEGGSFNSIIWNDGGNDCSLQNNVPPNNNYAIELTDGSGRPNATIKLPQYMYIDWVRVYQKSE